MVVDILSAVFSSFTFLCSLLLEKYNLLSLADKHIYAFELRRLKKEKCDISIFYHCQFKIENHRIFQNEKCNIISKISKIEFKN